MARSRGHACELIGLGAVRVGELQARRPAMLVGLDDVVSVAAVTTWVGRGALKLQWALDRFEIEVVGRRCLDVGASTGGFTQVLLRRGAATVVALDVGRDQLDPSLAVDPRVVERSGLNVRDVGVQDVGGPADIVVVDLSFISLSMVLGRLSEFARDQAHLVLLVKPQFEVGRERLGRGGIVRAPEEHRRVLLDLGAQCPRHGLVIRGLTASPVRGASGNVEFLLWCQRRDGASPAASAWEEMVDDAVRQEPTRSGVVDESSAALTTDAEGTTVEVQ